MAYIYWLKETHGDGNGNGNLIIMQAYLIVAFVDTAPRQKTNKVMWSSYTAVTDLLYIMQNGVIIINNGIRGDKTDVS